MLNIFKKTSTYERVEKLYKSASNAEIFQDRKSAVVEGAESIGYIGRIMVYHVGNVADIRLGYMPAAGWVAMETVKNPKTKVDGYVICVLA